MLYIVCIFFSPFWLPILGFYIGCQKHSQCASTASINQRQTIKHSSLDSQTICATATAAPPPLTPNCPPPPTINPWLCLGLIAVNVRLQFESQLQLPAHSWVLHLDTLSHTRGALHTWALKEILLKYINYYHIINIYPTSQNFVYFPYTNRQLWHCIKKLINSLLFD